MTVSSREWRLVRVTLCAMLLAHCLSVEAQQPQKSRVIGYLSPQAQSRESVRAEAIRFALRKRGYTEGQNIIFEYRYADGKLNRLAELAAELVRLRVDLIVVAGGYVAIQAVKNATTSIPIVVVDSGVDPVVVGLVESLARPGGNLTGVTNLAPELAGKRLELLKAIIPKIAAVAVLHDPAALSSVREVKEILPAAARVLELSIQSWEARAPEDFDRVFAALGKQGQTGLYPAGGPLINANTKRIANFTMSKRMPSIFSIRDAVDAGGLMFYGADLSDSYRRIAIYVDKIRNGAKPADLPIEQPTKFELVINLQTAKQIGLTIPPQVLARADRVIK